MQTLMLGILKKMLHMNVNFLATMLLRSVSREPSLSVKGLYPLELMLKLPLDGGNISI